MRRAAWYASALLAITTAGSALAATALATAPPKPGTAGTFDNALIAQTALGYVRRWADRSASTPDTTRPDSASSS